MANKLQGNDFRIEKIRIEKLRISGGDIRKFDVEADDILVSVKKEGVREPIHVYPAEGQFAIIDGQRRFQAARRAGLREVPCVVHREIHTEEQAFEFSFRHSILARNVHPLDKARAVRRMIQKEGGLATVCAKYGIPKSTLSQWDSLNRLDPGVQDLIRSPGELSRGMPGLHFKWARELARLPTGIQLEKAQRIIPLKDDRIIKLVLSEGKQSPGKIRLKVEPQVPYIDIDSSVVEAYGHFKAKGYKGDIGEFLWECVQHFFEGRRLKVGVFSPDS